MEIVDSHMSGPAEENVSQQFNLTGAGDVPVEDDYYILLSPESLLQFPNTGVGDSLLVRNPTCEVNPSITAEVRESEAISDNEAGVGVNIRYAIGAGVGSTIEVSETSTPKNSIHRRVFDRIFNVRPVICRVKTAAVPDPGFQVARIDGDIEKFTGVEEGDRLVIESPNGSVITQALPISEEFEERKQTEVQEVDSFPDCTSIVDTKSVGGASVDLPTIYVDYGTRSELGLDKRADHTETTAEMDMVNTGVCQPVRVYRDSWTFFLRLVNDITVPAVLGFVGFIVVFESILTPAVISVVVLSIVLIIITSLVYRARKFTVG